MGEADLEIFERSGGRLRVAHASGLPNADRDPASPEAHTDPLSTHLVELLEAGVRAAHAEYPGVAYEVRVGHGPAAQILRVMSETSELLVLERREHAWRGARLGRTARSLVRTSGCPVLIVPPVDVGPIDVGPVAAEAEQSTDQQGAPR